MENDSQKVGNDSQRAGIDRRDLFKMGAGVGLAVTHVESPNPDAVEYHSDGHGTVRIMGLRMKKGNFQETGIVLYSYRMPGSRE